MNVVAIIFYILAFIAAMSAVGILLSRNVFYGVLFLIVCLLALAGIFVIAFAEFVAITQLLIYAGGILVLIIFGVMLTSKISGKPLVTQNGRWIAGLIPGLVTFITLSILFTKIEFPEGITESGKDTVRTLGILFMTDYLLPFELAGVLLLAALVAAAISVSKSQTRKEG